MEDLAQIKIENLLRDEDLEVINGNRDNLLPLGTILGRLFEIKVNNYNKGLELIDVCLPIVKEYFEKGEQENEKSND